MKVLAIDTATEQCSVALRGFGETLERCVPTARSHAEILLPMVDDVMRAAGITLKNLDGLAFGRGPGAFTGVRIAVGVVQGISLGSGLPVVGVSTLAAVAQQFADTHEAVLVCMDARMNEVYWGLFARGAGGAVAAVSSERVSVPAEVTLQGRPVALGAGTGFRAYPQLAQHLALRAIDAAALPRAREVALLGELALKRGEGVQAGHAQPVYLRDQVAWIRPAQGK